MRRRSLQASIALLALGLLVSAAIDRDAETQQITAANGAPFAAPVFSITSGRGILRLQGTTTSASHEAALRQLVTEQFAHYETHTEFQPGVLLADSWESTTTRLLYALAATESAQAIMLDGSIGIRGVTTDAGNYATRLAFLRDNLISDTQFGSDVIEVDSLESFDELCHETFSRLVLGPVSFDESSADIRTPAIVTLDRIADFAHDCDQTTIAITGHTDASGVESWNKRLSLARAQAIADHFVQGGIDAGRLRIRGLGSSVPIADNTTAQGRNLNRRIEFELE